MAITPNSVVYFLSVPLENNYANQIRFANRTEQYHYMQSRIATKVSNGEGLFFTNLTYQRKDNVIRVPVHVDDLVNANYVMYQNTSYSDRWFYAFITKMEYINDGCTHVHIETDVWQTWFDRVTLKDSFIERMHVPKALDIPGNYLYEEGLELGEYVSNSMEEPPELTNLFQNYGVVISSTITPATMKSATGFYNGIYSGVGYFLFDDTRIVISVDGENYVESGTLTNAEITNQIATFIDMLVSDNKTEAITGLFIVPKFLYEDKYDVGIYFPKNEKGESVGTPLKTIRDSSTAYRSDRFRTKIPETLDGHPPRNKKLLCYPYQYLYVSNNNGASAIYNYEDFKADGLYNETEFRLEGAISPGCSIKMFPCNYRGIQENHEHGLALAKFPICSYSTDMYTAWLSQNAVSVNIEATQNLLGYVGGLATTVAGGVMIATGNPLGIGVAGAGLSSMHSNFIDTVKVINAVTVASKQPYQASGNLSSGDVSFASGKTTFLFYNNCIRKEFAERLDSFFDMYGYKINQVGEINLFTRSKWNFIKTTAVNLDGNVPQDDLKIIRAMFDNGITFWDKDAVIEDYSNPEENVDYI